MITYEIADNPKFMRLQAKVAKMGIEINPYLERGMTKTVIEVTSGIKPEVPVGVSGRLRQSIGGEVKTLGPGNIEGVVGSSIKEEYPSVMNYGRRPGATPPPAEALIRWVHVKGLAGTYSIKTRRRMGGKAAVANEDRQMAFMIARAIGRHGIKGRKFMEKGLQKKEGRIPGFFKSELDKYLEEVARGA